MAEMNRAKWFIGQMQIDRDQIAGMITLVGACKYLARMLVEEVRIRSDELFREQLKDIEP